MVWGWTRVEPINKQKRNASETLHIRKHTHSFLVQEVLLKTVIFKPLTLYNTFKCTSSSDKK